MDLLNAFLFATFCVAVGIAVLYFVADWLSPAEPVDYHSIRTEQAHRPTQIAQLGTVCTRDGILISQIDRLRAAVTIADRMIWQGGLNGRRLSLQQIRTDADKFAQLQVSPDVTIEMLGRCDETLLQKYPQGYWLISAALVRESARRRQVVAHPAILDPRAP
jgi:hypothetical protein